MNKLFHLGIFAIKKFGWRKFFHEDRKNVILDPIAFTFNMKLKGLFWQ